MEVTTERIVNDQPPGISIFYWFIRRNLVLPSSPTSFRTQSHRSFITGQCRCSGRFSSSTLIMSDVLSIYTPSWIQDWYQEDEIWAKDRRYSSRLWIQWTRNIKIQMQLTWMHRVFLGTSRKYGRAMKMQYTGLTSNLLKRMDLSSIKHDRTQLSFTTHSQIQKAIMMETGESFTIKFMRRLDFLHVSRDRNWWRCWRLPTNPTKDQTSNCEKGETSEEWATIHFAYSRNRQKCLVWLRNHKPKHCETCEWTIHRFVHTARGHGHWLQSDWIATCQIVLKCLYLTSMEDLPDIVWSMDHKMDKSLCSTFMSSDLLHSSYVWIQTVFPCGKHCQTMQTGTVSRLWLRRRSWVLKIHFWRNVVHIWKPYIPISCMCEKQTSVSPNSTESEIISVNAELILVGILALDFWDLNVWLFFKHNSEPW